MALATEYISHFNATLKTVEEVTPQEFVSRDFGKFKQVYTNFWDPGQEWQERMHVDPWLAAIRGFFLHPRQATGMSIWMCRCDYNMFPRFAALCDVFSSWQSPWLCPCQRYYLVGLCVGISVAVGVTIMYHLPAQDSPIFQLMYLNCDPVIRNLRLKQKTASLILIELGIWHCQAEPRLPAVFTEGGHSVSRAVIAVGSKSQFLKKLRLYHAVDTKIGLEQKSKADTLSCDHHGFAGATGVSVPRVEEDAEMDVLWWLILPLAPEMHPKKCTTDTFNA